MTAPLLLSTVGSLGDLFPVLALARALESAGQPVRLLLGPDDAETAAAEGFTATPFGPTSREMTEALGMTRSEIAASVFHDPSQILKRATYPRLAGLARDLLPHAKVSRAVLHTALAMAAPLAAELAGRPHIPLLLQPTMVHSALDPPRVSGFSPPMVPAPGRSVSRRWNRAWLRVVALEMRRRHGRAQNAVRRELALPPTRATPLFGHAVPPLARFGLWDPLFSSVPDDAPDLTLTGFAHLGLTENLPPDLTAFLDHGPEPLVVTLGSVAHELGGTSFWADAVALARQAGLRTVLLSGGQPTPTGPDIHATPFAPHAALFPRVRTILHHGGMGTLGEALAAGKPQLILPLGADQPDNARRAVRLGVAREVGRDLAAATAKDALQEVLRDDLATHARQVASSLIPHGAARAAHAILRALDTKHRHTTPTRKSVF